MSLFFYCQASVLSLQMPFEKKIYQAEKVIVIDGDLSEWETVLRIPVVYMPSGQTMESDQNISVNARFTFDSENFYTAVEVKDDLLEFKNRSWRYGDGFLLTFVDPYQGVQSERFYSFGIAKEGNKNILLLVNNDGKYFPRIRMDDFELNIKIDQTKNTIVYELRMSLDYLYPFKPFIHQKWGINLTYADSDGDGSGQKNLQLYPDPDYDTERSGLRRGAVFEFITRVPSEKIEFQCLLDATHYYNDSQREITYALNSPEKTGGWMLKYIQSHASSKQSDEKKIDMQRGLNISKLFIPGGQDPSGLYYLSLGILDDQNKLVHTEDKQYFVLNRNEINDFQVKINEVKDSEKYSEDEVFRESIPTLEIRLKWMIDYMEKAQPHAFIQELYSWYQDFKFLLKNVEENKPALFPLGRIARLAHRSAIDGTLQPYSVYVPELYNEKNPLPLVVTLHGSGVDEQETILTVAQKIVGEGRMNVMVLAPKARGLSDWYLGNSEKDVLECLSHLKNLYKVDEEKIILDGFSMGGYGAWRLAAMNPEMFHGVIIRSGAIKSPTGVKGESILDLYTLKKNLNILMIHGDRDEAVPVENARKMAARLKELGEDYRYIEVKDAGHGNYDKWPEIFKWLRDIIR